jgi:hypothetical protein
MIKKKSRLRISNITQDQINDRKPVFILIEQKKKNKDALATMIVFIKSSRHGLYIQNQHH